MSEASVTARRILIVEDDAGLAEALSDSISDAGYVVVSAANGAAALRLLATEAPFELVISDVQMEPVDGWQLLSRVRGQHPHLPVLLMTAYGSIEQAVRALHEGAVDFLAKPFEESALLAKITRYAAPAALALREQLPGDPIAVDPASVDLLRMAERLATNDLTVMIAGESGTGKEVIARFIHSRSTRSSAPFLAINCAAIPENMLEAVLFGYERGAFTGATSARAGKFEQAQGGTLLLDEISEMALPLQAKLLRVLQEREVERLGGKEPLALDVRVLATTNRDLRASVADGEFREDLYYRLNVLPLNLKPLRERPRDIVPLARAIAREVDASLRLTPAAEQQLSASTWPGNVRELENVIRRSAVLARGNVLDAADLLMETAAPLGVPQSPSPAPIGAPAHGALDEAVKHREHEVICEVLQECAGNRSEAAQRLHISPRTLRHKIARMRNEGVVIPGSD